MGACFSSEPEEGRRSSRSNSRSGRRAGNSNQPAVGKNQALKHELPRWKNEAPITLGQLASKRDEFWDTAPAFEGRKEIWDALRAAASACEAQDFELAQAMINGANITIPYGYLTDCYDELGNRYQLPVYVLSQPSNLQRDDSYNDSTSDLQDADLGDEVIIKLRLSTGKDLKLTVRNRHTVGKIKRILSKAENLSNEQRWFYGGKLLNDRLRVEELQVPKGHLIQVIVPHEQVINTNITKDSTIEHNNMNPTPISS